jgi:hypothetical protein
MRSYKSERVSVGLYSDATPEECERIIGKTVARIETAETSFTLIFTDGSTLELSGHCYEDSPLGVSVSADRTQEEENG